MAWGSTKSADAGGRSGLMVLQDEKMKRKMNMGRMYFDNILKTNSDFKDNRDSFEDNAISKNLAPE
jgi:hypothetical protein